MCGFMGFFWKGGGEGEKGRGKGGKGVGREGLEG